MNFVLSILVFYVTSSTLLLYPDLGAKVTPKKHSEVFHAVIYFNVNRWILPGSSDRHCSLESSDLKIKIHKCICPICLSSLLKSSRFSHKRGVGC